MTRRLVIAVAIVAALVPFGLGLPAGANGTEALGPPDIPIATGSGVAVAGTGLHVQPGTLAVSVPAGATVQQVLLYWEGHYHAATEVGDDDIVVAGQQITGVRIGGPTVFFGPQITAEVYRADITGLGLVQPGANTLTVSGLDFSYANNGAGIVVIYQEPGSGSTIQLRDGSDLAFAYFDSPLDATVPQTFTFTAGAESRVADLSLFAASVEEDRPNSVLVTVGGVTTEVVNPFANTSGAEWETVRIPVTIPAGATSITVQAVSKVDGSSALPASFNWLGAFLSVPTLLPPPPAMCARTPGYWKTHSELGPAPYDPTWAKLPAGAASPFFGSGATWLEALGTPVQGNAYWILSRAYGAAVLNQLAGSDTSAVASQMATAATLLSQYDGSPYPMSQIKNGVRDQFVSVAEVLDDFNNGLIGPAHCG